MESMTKEEYEERRQALAYAVEQAASSLEDAVSHLLEADRLKHGNWSASDAGVDTAWLREVDMGAGVKDAYASLYAAQVNLKKVRSL